MLSYASPDILQTDVAPTGAPRHSTMHIAWEPYGDDAWNGRGQIGANNHFVPVAVTNLTPEPDLGTINHQHQLHHA